MTFSPTDHRRAGLEAMLRPRSIAIVGASERRGGPADRVQANLARLGYTGAVHLVNPRLGSINGRPTFPSVADIPDPVDLALLSVRAELIPGALRECAAAGVRGAIVYASGFGELSADGRGVEQEMRRLSEETGMRIAGPNSQGFFDVRAGVCSSWASVFTEHIDVVPSGIAWVSQSGAMGQVTFDLFRRMGIGLDYWISTGNEIDIDFVEAASLIVEDPGVRVVCGYVESLKDVARVRELGRRARELGKVIVLLKGGRTEAGANAVVSHTGALAGRDAVYRALLREAGIVYAEDVHDLVATAHAAAEFGRRGLLGRAPILAILTNSGGLGAMIADDSHDLGIPLAPVTPDLRVSLAGFLPPFVQAGNPIDLATAATSDPSLIPQIITELALHGVTVFVVCLLGIKESATMDPERLFRELAAAQEEHGVQVILVPYGGADDVDRRARASGIVTVADVRRAVRAIDHLRAVGAPEIPDPPRSSAPTSPAVPPPDPARMSEWTTKGLLRDAGLPVAPGRLARTGDDPESVASELMGPFVVKGSSARIAHKTEFGLVSVGVDRAGLGDAVESMRQRLGVLVGTDADGVIIEEMGSGVEVIVGVRAEPPLGHAIVLGLGGIYTELLNDTSVRLLPISRADAQSMIRELRGGGVLTGSRGIPPRDIDALADLLVATGELALRSSPAVEELEMNPVFVGDSGVVIADALLVTTRESIVKPRFDYDAVPVGTRFGPISLVVDETLNTSQRPGATAPATHVEPTILARSFATLVRDAWETPRALLHTGTELRLVEPIPVGSTLTIDGELVEKYVKRNREYYVIDSVTRVDGRIASTERHTFAEAAPRRES